MDVFDGEVDIAEGIFFEQFVGEEFLDLGDGGHGFTDGVGEHFVCDSGGEGIEREDAFGGEL